MLVVCTENGFTNQIAWAKCFHGWALIEQDRPREGIAEMYEGIAILDDMRVAILKDNVFRDAPLRDIKNLAITLARWSCWMMRSSAQIERGSVFTSPNCIA